MSSAKGNTSKPSTTQAKIKVQAKAPPALIQSSLKRSELKPCLETVEALIKMFDNIGTTGDFDLYPVQCFLAKLKDDPMPIKDPFGYPPPNRTEALLVPWLADKKEAIARASKIYVTSYEASGKKKVKLVAELMVIKGELENRIAKL